MRSGDREGSNTIVRKRLAQIGKAKKHFIIFVIEILPLNTPWNPLKQMSNTRVNAIRFTK
jgi:hypothetical protein